MLDTIREHVTEGNIKAVPAAVQQALDEGFKADVILNEALIPAMRHVGELFEEGEYFVPEMLMAARAMQAGLVILKPLLAEIGAEPIGKVAIGTVKGDLHDIGKSLVAMMMEGAGFAIMDMGVDVPPEKFVEAVHNGAQIIAMSALLTTTMPNMGVTIKAIEEAGLRDKVKIMVGGAPVTQAYADQIGADAFSTDASAAARTALSLLNG
ncbi:MAG: corrinoid protein [Anaerolineaceae bacterium]|nr:corrinoid protein [Anaerolineaceae bacterium]